MSDQPLTAISRPTPRGPFGLRALLVALTLLAILALAATAVAILLFLGHPIPTLAPSHHAAIAAGLAGVLLITFILAIALILHLLALQLRRAQAVHDTLFQLNFTLQSLHELLQNQPPANTASAAAVPAPSASPAEREAPKSRPELNTVPLSPAIVDLLLQLRDVALMSDQQRAAASVVHWERRKQEVIRLIDRAIDTGHWSQAATHLSDLRHLLPDDPDVPRLATRIDTEQTERMQQDVETARVQLRHLMSITAWTQTEEIIASLRRRYPTASDVAALASEVQRERTAFDEENFARLMRDLKDATDHKQWRRAIVAADEILRRHPNHPTTARLRIDLPRLHANADAQDRREQELLFKDLLHRQRYEEARTVAQAVIEKYPHSSAATELTKLMPKVEELMRQEKQKRQQPV